LDQFRCTRPQRKQLPESLWQVAVGLARQHGVYSVAQPLRLDYIGTEETAEARMIGRFRAVTFLSAAWDLVREGEENSGGLAFRMITS
jgi:hypothetical protein